MSRSPLAAVAVLAGLLGMPVAMAPPSSAAPGATTRVSVATGGTQADNDSDTPALSADGRYVAFVSSARNLVSGDTNGVQDVFLRDRVSGSTVRVSVDSAGAQANGLTDSPAITGDGRYVTFQSVAGNLTAGDTNSVADVFVHDRDTGATTRVSVAADGTQADNASQGPAITEDGRYVAFVSDATNLVAGDSNGCDDVFLHDRDTGATTRVNVASDGTQSVADCRAEPSNRGVAISADGRHIAFSSSATNLVAGAAGPRDVFVHDRVTGATTRVSVPVTPTVDEFAGSFSPAISTDGRHVAFTTALTGDWAFVFVHDRATGTTTRADGAQNDDTSSDPALSSDGRYLTFGTTSRTTSRTEVVVRDRVAGTTHRVSVARDGALADGASYRPAISGDGRKIAFASGASNLVAGDSNGMADVFVRDWLLPDLAAVTRLSDVNGDAVTDLVARDAAGRLWLYPGNGSGGFGSVRQIGRGWNGMTAILTPGDVTGDRNADILARDTAGRLWLYPGNGASGFLPSRQVGRGWNSMTAITHAANLDGAGGPDVLARDATGALWLYPLKGDGVFGARSQVGFGWNGYTILGPGDVSGDGKADIVARDAAGSLWLYRGKGTGRVGARSPVSGGWAAMTALVTPGNWDRAGGNDLLARDRAGALWLHPGDNAGGLDLPRQVGRGWQGMSFIG